MQFYVISFLRTTTKEDTLSGTQLYLNNRKMCISNINKTLNDVLTTFNKYIIYPPKKSSYLDKYTI